MDEILKRLNQKIKRAGNKKKVTVSKKDLAALIVTYDLAKIQLSKAKGANESETVQED